jgi:hypothetical protein
VKKAPVICALFCLLVLSGIAAASYTFSATSLNNIPIGGPYMQAADIRFQAATDSALTAVRTYWIVQNPSGRAGYMAGNGGDFEYQLRADADGQPGSVIETASSVQHQITENKRGDFPLAIFSSDLCPLGLTKGTYYHIVVTNIGSGPSENWSSLDFLWNASRSNQTPDVQIQVSVEGGAFKPGEGGTYIGSPVALFYANKTVQGYGDIAVGSEYPNGLECGSAYGFPAALCQQ